MLKALRSKNRKRNKKGKLFQHLKSEASRQIDIIISQVYEMMLISENALDFKMKYSKEYKLHFQTSLFEKY